MVVAQLFEVTVSADGYELSSKRVSKLSRQYHLHKKQLRQSARMADGLPDAAAADGGNDDGDRSGGQFDESADAEFSLSTQPPSIGHRSTISVAMNHPAAAARRGAKKPLPPRRESPGRNCKRTNANAAVGRLPPRPPRLPPRPPSLPPRPPIISTTPLAPRKSPPVEPVDDDLIVIAAGEDGHRQGGEEAVATRVGEVLGDEVLELLSVDSSDGDAFSVHSSVHKSSVAYGNGVLCDSPTDFVEHNDPMHSDLPTDNEVSKYSFYSRPIALLSSSAFCWKLALLCATWIQ